MYGHKDCYTTYFLFDQGLREHVKGNGRSVSGYAGPGYAYFSPESDFLDRGYLGRTLCDAEI